MHYFPHTKPKTWKVIEALCVYDKEYPGCTFFSVLEILKSDLVQFKTAQGSLKKHIDPILEDVIKLGNLNCHKQPTSDDTESNEQEPRKETSVNQDVHVDANTNEHLAQGPGAQLNSSSSSSLKTPDSIPSATNSVKITKFSGNFVNGGGPNRKRLNEISNSMPSAGQPTNVVLTEGQKTYRIMTPDHKSDDLHRPKLRKAQLDVLKDLVHFGTSFVSDNPITMNKYKTYERDQRENRSLCEHGLLEHIIHLLENDNTELFVQQVWTAEIDGLTDKATALLEIFRYTLTSFHLVFNNVSLSTQNHERTPFIENIVPSLLSLSKITGFVEFKWCETEFTSNKYLELTKCDYSQSTTKYVDALGCLRTSNNMEIIIVEASSGKLKERTVHTIEDCLKLLECGVFSLRKEAILNKNSSIATFKKLKVFGIQVIKNQVTLSELYMNDKKSWNFIEKRTATLPSSWHDRILLIQYLELVATIFDDLCEIQHVLKQLMKENLGLDLNESPSVATMFEE
ncbi:hypothetical protein DFQ29_005883 [Apophysomyces sp. BC1021]|nr:hypothetical protein DFQ29_005883 [Apophysomyces sp. BC1021]